jgi:protein-arginine kinase activator protein McsA
MPHEVQIEWLKAHRDVFEQNNVLKDQLNALENALSDVLRRNGELTEVVNKVEIEAAKEVREQMRTETKNAMNEAKVSMFDNVLEIVGAVKR